MLLLSLFALLLILAVLVHSHGNVRVRQSSFRPRSTTSRVVTTSRHRDTVATSTEVCAALNEIVNVMDEEEDKWKTYQDEYPNGFVPVQCHCLEGANDVSFTCQFPLRCVLESTFGNSYDYCSSGTLEVNFDQDLKLTDTKTCHHVTESNGYELVGDRCQSYTFDTDGRTIKACNWEFNGIACQECTVCTDGWRNPTGFLIGYECSQHLQICDTSYVDIPSGYAVDYEVVRRYVASLESTMPPTDPTPSDDVNGDDALSGIGDDNGGDSGDGSTAPTRALRKESGSVAMGLIVFVLASTI